jgi:hypothetical protein
MDTWSPALGDVSGAADKPSNKRSQRNPPVSLRQGSNEPRSAASMEGTNLGACDHHTCLERLGRI